MSDARHETAQALLEALQEVTPVEPVTGRLGNDLGAAYEVQEIVINERSSEANPRIGRKVGLTSPAVQKQLGVDQPDFGVLLADMEVQEGSPVPSDRLLQPKIEAEVAFVMAKDVHTPSRQAVLDAVDYMVPALEIVDSRIRDWNITIVDTVADNASSGMFVLGKQRRTLSELDPAGVEMEMTRDGEVVSTGNGEACLGDPLNALVWVAETAHRLGRPLRAGEVVLSGALGPMATFPPSSRVVAEISGLGTVTAVASEVSDGD